MASQKGEQQHFGKEEEHHLGERGGIGTHVVARVVTLVATAWRGNTLPRGPSPNSSTSASTTLATATTTTSVGKVDKGQSRIVWSVGRTSEAGEHPTDEQTSATKEGLEE